MLKHLLCTLLVSELKDLPVAVWLAMNGNEDRDKKIQRFDDDCQRCWEAYDQYFAFSHIHVWNFRFKLNGTHNSVNPLNRYNAVTKEYERGDFRKMFKLHGNLSGEYEKVRAS
jgi:hypothetical protein